MWISKWKCELCPYCQNNSKLGHYILDVVNSEFASTQKSCARKEPVNYPTLQVNVPMRTREYFTKHRRMF